jgi:glycosyltransferase involved in cell wall biosynthesis
MKRILVVGTTKNKNVDLIYSLISNFPNCVFVFIGKYENSLKYSNFSSYSNLTDNELVEQYKTANILLFPTLSEGFGMPIIESQYFGLPVITSKYEPMYSVAGKECALFVNPKNKNEIINAINTLLTDEVRRKYLINNGFSNANKYLKNNILIKLSNLYNKILN